MNYLSIIFCYLIFYFDYYIIKSCIFPSYRYLKNYFKKYQNAVYEENNNSNDNNNNKYPRLNLIYYNINPFLDVNYEIENNNKSNIIENNLYKIRVIIKVLLVVASLIITVYYYKYLNWKFISIN